MIDYCTSWPDGAWGGCCQLHDQAYDLGLDKIGADLDLAACVAATGYPLMGAVMLAGVSLFGGIFWLRARWRRAASSPSSTTGAASALFHARSSPMDRTVPAGAARLLDFIRDTEVGTEGRPGYDVIFGFNQSKLPKPVTSMSVDEVLGQQQSWTSRFGSSATGAYQFMRATLSGLKDELGLAGRQILDPDLQDRLGYHLLKRRGYERYVSGQIDRIEFGRRLSQEWASFPVLAAVRGAHANLKRGQSYYAGDALNKALVSPETVEGILDEVLELAKETAASPIAKPEQDVFLPAPTAPAPSVPVAKSRFDPARFSKLFGSLIGALVAWSVANQFIPDGIVSQAQIDMLATLVGSVIGTFVAPANATSSDTVH